MNTWTIFGAICVAATATATLATPTPAHACGGTFCDAGPQLMPVDQKGENILFVMEDGWVEAHVQIQYEGNPEQFAWIVPVTSLPEVEVGSDPLFDNLLAATVPTFTLNTRTEDNCIDNSRDGFGCGMTDDVASGGDGGFFDEEPPEDDPTVLVQDTVGAFEFAVLEGGTVQGISQWLDDNGYARDDEAPEILQQYLDEDFMFVAFKLQPGTNNDEIHPVVLRYQGSEPCVPLRLTRIAAEDDMGVRAFFLGESRVVPTNYRHVEINPLKIDWLNLGSNYDEVVSLAVDEEGSDGHGFVTEYAGPSTIVPTGGILDRNWDSSAFAEIEPWKLSGILRQQRLLDCTLDECFLTHPMLESLLQTHFPTPRGVTDMQFYENSSNFDDNVNLDRWDPAGFAAAFEERIVGPAERALDLLELPYLTRLYTTISPGEMTSDPLFHENPELADVSNQWSATRVIDCEGPDRLEFPDGLQIIFDDNGVPPPFSQMPYSMRVEEVPDSGGPMVLADREAEIRSILDLWNDDHRAQEGCDCRSSRRPLDGLGTLTLMVLLGLRARRRRR